MLCCSKHLVINPPRCAVLPRHGRDWREQGPVAAELADRFFCIMPTSTVYCAGQTYADKADEVRQIKEFLRGQGVERVEMVVAAGKALSYGNIRRQMADSLEDKPLPAAVQGAAEAPLL